MYNNFIRKLLINSIIIIFIVISLLININLLIQFIFLNNEYSNTFIFLVFLLSFSFTIFLFFSLKQNKEIKINISITLLSILVTLYAIEVFLYYKNNNFNSREVKANDLSIPFDKRNKLQVINDLRKEGIDAHLKNVPILLSDANGINSKKGKIFPLGGIANSTTLLLNESGFFPIIETDEHGFNNPKGLYKKNLDFLIIGDSYAEGDGVKNEENVASIIREKDYQIISLGQNGNGPLLEYASLREYGKYLKPKIVLWMYFVNDLGDLKIELESSLLRNYLNDENFTQNLINRQSEIDHALKKYLNNKMSNKNTKNNKKNFSVPDEILQFKNTLSFLNIIPKVFIESRGNVPKKKFEEILIKSKQLIESWEGKMYLIYLPSYFAYASDNENRFYKYILQTAEKNNIPLIDIHTEVFLKQNDPLELFALKMNSHYNKYGYSLVAETILKKIKGEM